MRFGIQEMSSELTDKGHRLFKVNGKPILVRGGGWASDMFLRPITTERARAELRYVKEMGLNTIRLEGKLETDEFYDLADEEGVLLMPGWCCCDQWETWDKWDAEDHRVGPASLREPDPPHPQPPERAGVAERQRLPASGAGGEGLPRRPEEAGVEQARALQRHRHPGPAQRADRASRCAGRTTTCRRPTG